ncbi:LAMI_0A08350g1_1 [Lachancea mirantina]|uniref:LAMI_0A08350g1_1 n=1 Tax=Lachancea mirantina TaxID=1230905 RepID=A0A1G4IR88_9SACH|nr:LAMI_0A08350g1_1 [Lachancea mirantina]
MADPTDEDFSSLPLEARASHKVWKARLSAYKDLASQFESASTLRVPDALAEYWRNPEKFATYIVDSNVVAQEQALSALLALLDYLQKLPALPKTDKARDAWIPLLAEKGLGSSRASTKAKAQECILTLVAFDVSAQHAVELVEPLLSNKLPRLVASCVECIAKIVECFGLVNIGQLQDFLTHLLEPIPKLSSHADRNVRSQTMNLISQLYKWLGKNLLQEVLLDKLKPIQQRDLDKTFNGYTGSIPPQEQPRLFQWQLQQQRDLAQKDQDGDTLMGNDALLATNASDSAYQQQPQIDPFDLLAATCVLDKLPDNFSERVTSTKWKDRVEVLEELLTTILVPAKKLEYKNQDYNELLRLLAHVIQKDANVQAVTIAATAVHEIGSKLKSNFNRNYASVVFVPLLDRTKEKKQSVSEALNTALDTVALCCGIDVCLEDTITSMKHKTPQVRIESTKFLTRLLTQWQPSSANTRDELLVKLLPELSPVILKIVNDTQQTVRDAGFGALAVLVKLFGEREMSDVFDKLDNLKKKKVNDYLAKVEVKNVGTRVAPTVETVSTKPPARVNSPPTTAKLAPRQSGVPASRKPLSVLPSKRGPSSPLKLDASLNSNILTDANAAKSRLTTRSLTTDSTMASRTSSIAAENEDLKLQKQKWMRERQELFGKITDFQAHIAQLKTENTQLLQQMRQLQASKEEVHLESRAKDTKISKLHTRISVLENELEIKSGLSSSNFGVRSISSQGAPSSHFSMVYPGTPPPRQVSNSAQASSDRSSSEIAHTAAEASQRGLTRFSPRNSGRARSPSESSDDLPGRVTSLQLSSGSKSHALSSNFVNDESWKRAAEVTSLLKARIERMRAKTRGMSAE